MARTRGKQQGYLRRQGKSWVGTWNEPVLDESGKEIWVKRSRALCSSRSTKKQAQAEFDKQILNELATQSRHPRSQSTVAEFWRRKMVPLLSHSRKRNTEIQYISLYGQHIKPALGHLRLRDVRREHVQHLIYAKQDKGYSAETVRHIHKVVSALFEHAITLEYVEPVNPASRIELPERAPVRPNQAYTYAQARLILGALPEPVRTMALISMCTSLNVAEVCGLHWKHVNLSNDFVLVDGEAIPPRRAAVRYNFTASKLGSVKTGHRYRTVPLPQCVIDALARLRKRERWNGGDDFVFVNSRGRAMDAHNISNRIFAPLSEKPSEKRPKAIGIHINWHSFRHTAATWAEATGMAGSDRQALLGHGSASMTALYTHEDLARQSASIEAIAEALIGAAAEGRPN
ncbi:MAG: tyrosine-type recombinase/integrase [Bryobacteraceae bacterium]